MRRSSSVKFMDRRVVLWFWTSDDDAFHVLALVKTGGAFSGICVSGRWCGTHPGSRISLQVSGCGNGGGMDRSVHMSRERRCAEY